MAKHNYVSPKQVKGTEQIRHGSPASPDVPLKVSGKSGLTNPSEIGGDDESIKAETAERKNIGAAAFQREEASEGDTRFSSAAARSRSGGKASI